MKLIKFIVLGFLCLTLAGCLNNESTSYSFDYKVGEIKITFHNLRSMKETDNKDYSLEKDWITLKGGLSQQTEDIPAGLTETSKIIFQEKKYLSGEIAYLASDLKKSFPSAVSFLTSYEKKSPEFTAKEINHEIFLFLPADKQVTVSNGKIIKTKGNNIVVWPAEQQIFELTETNLDKKALKQSVSLLPYYLKGKEGKQ